MSEWLVSQANDAQSFCTFAVIVSSAQVNDANMQTKGTTRDGYNIEAREGINPIRGGL